MGLRKNCISTFASGPVRWVNFRFANRMVAPIGFYLLAGHIVNGRIKCRTNANLTNRAEYDPTSNTIFAEHSGFGASYHDEKATLIHEGTHAMLDAFFPGRDINGNASTMTVEDDETIAFLAEAIYLIGAKLSNFNKNATNSPRDMALKVARAKVNTQRPWDGCLTTRFSRRDVAPLQRAIRGHRFYRNWSSPSQHDGV